MRSSTDLFTIRKHGSQLAVQPQRIDSINRQNFNVLAGISPKKRLAYIQGGHIGETELTLHSVSEAEEIIGDQVEIEQIDSTEADIHMYGRILVQQPFHIDELEQRVSDRGLGESAIGFLKVLGEYDRRIEQRFGYDLKSKAEDVVKDRVLI
jgi:uncharacterized small protein (DUF1192 family)